jgi:nucleoside-diphosphate-sugar epimerase
MIVGRGDIASAVEDRDGFTFFCSGVSNRLPLTPEACRKEMIDVWCCDKRKMLVYISTLSVYYSDSEYTRHKLNMEYYIRNWFANYAIVRIGNITWGNNPNTLINHLRKDQSRIDDTYRYLIDKDEFCHWLKMIPANGKHEMNITGRMMKVNDIVNEINQGKI